MDGKIYEKAATTLDNIDRNILLYAGGIGIDGKGGGGPRFKPIDNEIPDSSNVQANPGQGADVPQPVRNAGPTNTNNSRQQQLNLGTSNSKCKKNVFYNVVGCSLFLSFQSYIFIKIHHINVKYSLK